MWMMGRRKLRPLIPSPAAGAAHTTCRCFHTNPSFVPADQEQRKYRDHDFRTQHVNNIVSSSSTRWNPTPEQLQTLEELYRRGTRTPSADQIEHITAHLRRYGKIEGKNVFYWFQNHKARERQKRRRQLVTDHQGVNQCRPQEDGFIAETKDSGENKTDFEVQETSMSWGPIPRNRSTGTAVLHNAAEGTDSIKRAGPGCSTCHGWVQFVEGELEHRRSLVDRNDTWQAMQWSSSCSPATLLGNPNISTSTATSADTTISTNTTTSETASTLDDPKLRKSSQDLRDHRITTLQLFPVWGNCKDNEIVFAHNEEAGRLQEVATDTKVATAYKFFEFLPLQEC